MLLGQLLRDDLQPMMLDGLVLDHPMLAGLLAVAGVGYVGFLILALRWIWR